MTRKDYIVIADAIRKSTAETRHLNDIMEIASGIAFYLKKDNERFDTDKFINACITERH